MIARRPIGRETYRRFMAQRETRQDLAFFDDLEQRQHEIAGDAENLTGTVIPERRQQRMSKRRHGIILQH
jgi:hypothetical protein